MYGLIFFFNFLLLQQKKGLEMDGSQKRRWEKVQEFDLDCTFHNLALRIQLLLQTSYLPGWGPLPHFLPSTGGEPDWSF